MAGSTEPRTVSWSWFHQGRKTASLAAVAPRPNWWWLAGKELPAGCPRRNRRLFRLGWR